MTGWYESVESKYGFLTQADAQEEGEFAGA